MDVQKSGFLSIEQLTDRYLGRTGRTVKSSETTETTFRDVLEQKSGIGLSDSLKFSKHAQMRLQNRGISISDSQMERLNSGVEKAEHKGIRDSLVLVDELAFIVNVPSRTVVTALDSANADENVFTNINGAVIN